MKSRGCPKSLRFNFFSHRDFRLPVYWAAVILCLPVLIEATSSSMPQTGSSVPTIANPKQPRPAPGRPCRPVFSDEIIIGGGDDPQTTLSTFAGAAIAKDGSVFLLDMTDCRVLAFTAAGKFLRSFGRRGQGPGEFEWPMIIRLSPDNEILVEDFQRCMVSAFSPDGRLLRSISTAVGLGFNNLTVNPNGGFVAQQVSNESSDLPHLLRKFDASMKPGPILESRAGIDPRTKKIKLGAVFWYVIDPQGWIYVPDAAEYVLRVYSPDGRLDHRITREFDPMKSPPGEQKSPEGLPGGVQIVIESPKYVPAIRDCLLDESGRLLVNVQEKEIRKGTSVIDIFDPEGRYIARTALPGRPVAWKNGRVYLKDENENGYPILRSRRVDWR
jgi:hypothetical protein